MHYCCETYTVIFARPPFNGHDHRNVGFISFVSVYESIQDGYHLRYGEVCYYAHKYLETKLL